MNTKEIKIFHWVPACLKQLNDLGFSLAVATNQPAFAKGKVTKEALEEVQSYILDKAQGGGAVITSSNVCFHRSEDLCSCRKPKTGLLEQAFNKGFFDRKSSWMVGDRATDIMAGNDFQLQTAWLGPAIDGDEDLLNKSNIKPIYRGKDLRDFVKFIEKLSISSSFSTKD